jgi:hypothetical protein
MQQREPNMATVTACPLHFHICTDDCRYLKPQEVQCDWVWDRWNVGEHRSNQSQLQLVLRDPVPHLQRQTKGLGLLVEEVLQHGEVHGGVEV